MKASTKLKVKNLCKHYGLNLYKMLDALIISAEENDPVLTKIAEDSIAIVKDKREKIKDMKKLVLQLKPEELEILLANAKLTASE